MTISIEPTDFGQDIMDSVSPILGALGLLGADGSLDINGWSLEKALGVFGTYERTEFILNMLSGYLSMPKSVYREITTGLIVKKGELSPNEVREEEWFPISQTDDWSVNLTVYHKKLEDHPFQSSTTALPTPSNPHSIEIGLGISIDDLEIPISSGPLELSASIGIPIVEVRNELVGSEYKIDSGIPKLEVNRLIWEETGNPLARVALSGLLKPTTGDFTIGAMSSSGIALRTAFGKESSSGANDGLVLKLSLLDFVAKQGDLPSTLEIDLINLVSGGVGSILDQIVPTLIDMIPGAAGEFAEHLLPLLGLMDSDWSSWAGPSSAPNWPRIDVMALIDDLPDFDAIWVRIQNYLLALSTPEIAKQWLTHLSKLIFFGNPRAPSISGDCTYAVPLKMRLVDTNSLDVYLLIRIWDDVDGTKLLDVGVEASVSEEIANTVTINGNSDVWLVSIPLSNASNRSLFFIPELELYLQLAGIGTQPLLSATAGDDGSALANLSVIIEQAKLGVKLSRSRDIDPTVELLNVTIGDPPSDQNFQKIDLTSGSSVMDALGGVLDAILNTVSDVLAQNNVLQWLGSLVGLVAPRGYPFRRVDEEYAGGTSYEKGQLVYHLDKVYEVTVGGNSPENGHEPVHSGGAEMLVDNGPLKFLHLGSNTPIWETDDSADKRIDLMDLIQDPLGTISEYHRTLLDDASFDYDGEVRTAWVYVFEALGNLVNTALSPLMNVESPQMLDTNQTIVTGSGTETSPWKILLANDGDLPNFSLIANPITDSNGLSERIQIGLSATISIIGLRPNLQLELGGIVELVSIPLVPIPQSSLPILLPRIRLDIFLHDAFGDTQIHLLELPGLLMSIEGLSTSFEWQRTQGFGWIISINSPRIGSIAPDFKHLGAQISPAEMNDFMWTGSRLWLPDDGFLKPDLESFTSQGDDPDDDIFVMPESNQSVTIKWDFFGLGCPSMGFNTWSGLFGFIDQDANVNSFIDLEPNQSIIENEGVRMILGQIMALRGGGVGFFASTFLRINPHLLHLDLGDHIENNGYQFVTEADGPSNWPSNWGAYHPRGRGRLGLGPFSLPYDWPEVNWSNLLSSPAEEFSSFITDVFSGISLSGEPFALPALRWIGGFIRNCLPDLSSPTLGWPFRIVNGVPSVMMPDVPSEISGQGTYEKPWRINLADVSNSKVELLLWLDPDGPNTSNQIQNVLTSSDLKVLELLENDTLNVMHLIQHTPDNWPEVISETLLKLAKYSERVEHAIGDVSPNRLANDLFELDQFLKTSDGFSTTLNQVGANTRKVSSSQRSQYLGSYLTSLQQPEIYSEVLQFIEETVPEDWTPINPGNTPSTLVVIIHDLVDRNYSSINGITNQRPTYKLSEFLSETYNLSSYSMPIYQWNQHMSVDANQFANSQPVIQSSSGFIELRLSNSFNSSTNHLDGLSEQILLSLQNIQTIFSGKIAIIAHGVSGTSLMKLVEQEAIDDTLVSGILTINTPHYTEDLEILKNQKIKRALNLLSLLETDNSPIHETSSNIGLDNKKYLSKEALLQTAEVVANTAVQLEREVVD